MIVVQDCIEVDASALARLQALFRDGYMPGTEARGLMLIDERVSPPLALADQPNTLWLHWSLADAGAFWAARFASGDPAVVAFWNEVDSFVLRRERHYLAEGAEILPVPQDTRNFQLSPQAWRETAQLYLRDGITDSDRAGLAALLGRAASELPGVLLTHLGENLVPDYGAGHYTWDLVYPDRATADAARAGAFWREQLVPALDRNCRARSALGLQTLGAGAREPALAGGIKRTALYRLLPGVSVGQQTRFEQDTLEMAAHIPAMLNWRLSRAQPLDWNAAEVAAWSYVWEQEYATIEGLMVDYMMHPHHWAHIDRCFDPESGAQIIDTALCHAFCPLESSVIVR